MIVELSDTDIATLSAGGGFTKPLGFGWWDDFIDIIIDYRSPSDPNKDFL